MNLDKVVERVQHVVIAMLILMVAVCLCLLMDILFTQAPLPIIIAVMSGAIGVLVYVFWGSWKK